MTNVFVNAVVEDGEGKMLNKRVKSSCPNSSRHGDPAKFAGIGSASRAAHECRKY